MKPHVTEKSMLAVAQNAYAFRVGLQIKKSQIKKLVEEKHKVNVVKIQTIKIKGKTKTAGKRRRKIKTSDWKKAIVVLKAGQKIESFGEVHEEKKKQKTK